MHAINHDIFLAAIERYPWRNLSYTRGRLIASSPFGSRADNTPSFSLVVDTDSDAFGCWNDAGAVDPYWARGSPAKLYAFLRNITLQEALEELTDNADVDEHPTLRVRIRVPEPQVQRSPIDITPYIQHEVTYLTGRNISPVIQRLYRCGHDSKRNAVVMPWCAPNGQALNVKFRATWGKAFFYAKGGAPVKTMIYGIDIAYRRNIKRAVIGEAEIDAMTASSAGTFGLAVGGSEFTDEKAELLRRSPIEDLLIAGDNDAAGEKLRWEIERKMRGYMRLYNVAINGVKDFNALGIEGTREACASATQLLTVRPRLIVR